MLASAGLQEGGSGLSLVQLMGLGNAAGLKTKGRRCDESTDK